MQTEMRVAIVGSRDYPHLERVTWFVRALRAKHPDAVVVSGGARGVDTVAVETARAVGLPEPCVWPADWDGLGRRAGFVRNDQIVADADVLVAFWDGRSRGTRHSLGLARTRGIPVFVYGPDGRLR